MNLDEKFMAAAVSEALKGGALGEVPIGAVAVRDGAIVARGHNCRNALADLTAHAEMMCLRDLSKQYQGSADNFNLSDVTIYSTLEPCAMCLGAMIHYKVKRVVFGESDLLAGACGSKYNICGLADIKADSDVLRQECRKPLLDFFEKQLGHKSARWGDIELPES